MTPEAAKYKKLGVKMQNLKVIIPAQEFLKVQNNRVMNDPQTRQKSKIGSYFCKMCTIPMIPCPLLAQPLILKGYLYSAYEHKYTCMNKALNALYTKCL